MNPGHPKPEIAVVTPAALVGLGLKAILEKVIPAADIAVFGSFAEFAAADTARYVHYFVSLQIFVRHSAFFLEHRQKTILLGSGRTVQFAGMRQLDITSGEQRLVHDLLLLRSQAPRPDHALPHPEKRETGLLTPRESEVLALIARGLLNKQIADRLSIGLTTVISHRRNIMEKLGVKSVAGLVVCAVGMGYADESEAGTPHK